MCTYSGTHSTIYRARPSQELDDRRDLKAALQNIETWLQHWASALSGSPTESKLTPVKRLPAAGYPASITCICSREFAQVGAHCPLVWKADDRHGYRGL